MKILVLSDNPLQRTYGDGLRALGLFTPLSKRHRLDHLCFARPGEAPDPDARSIFSSVTVLPFPTSPPRALPQRVRDALAVERFRATSPEMRGEVARRITDGEVDLVLDVACNMLLNLPREMSVPLVVDSIDEALLRDLRELKAAHWRAKPRMLYQTWMFWRYERRTMARAQANVYVSPTDAETYLRFFPGRTASVVPNGVDTAHFAPSRAPRDPATLVFEGNMMFGPNVDTARRLALEVLPRVRLEVPGARLVLVGRDPAPAVRALASPHVQVTGTVDDVRPFLARGTVLACPMRLGSGIKNKVLQAWAMALPVVASSAALAGLSARDGHNVVARDDLAGFAAAVVQLMRNPETAMKLGRQGRETVEREYTWAVQAARFERVLLEAAAAFRARERTSPLPRRAVADARSVPKRG